MPPHILVIWNPLPRKAVLSMLKSITPIWSRLRHIHRPELFLVRAHAPVDGDQPTVGQRLAERVAASVGSWWFLGGQAFFLFLWLVYNTLVFTRHFDNLVVTGLAYEMRGGVVRR